MSDLIDRQAAIDLWDKYHNTIAVDAMQYDAELRELPSAQPEIVYCKDCKYSEYHKLYGDRFCLYNYGADIVPDLHFCGYAERRAK